MTVGSLLGSIVQGAALGLQFNPLTAAVGCVAAAVLAGFPEAPESRRPLAAGVVALAWLLGDGARIGAALMGNMGTTPPAVALVVWATVGLLVGYVAPTLAGVAVGTRVVRGTGWLSAGAVAPLFAGALSIVAPALAEVLARLV